MPEPSTLRQLLLCSHQQDSTLAMQGAVLRDAGYAVATIATKKEIQERIQTDDFNIIVLNHTLSFADRKLLAKQAKQNKPESGVLVLHHSGSLGNPHVDLAVDSRLGAQAMLRALKRLESMLHAKSHHTDGDHGVQAPYFVVADGNRNYTFVTDDVCELLGYDRANLLEMRIDNIVAGSTPATVPLFKQFVAEGGQTGRIVLRHRSGNLITVNYWAKVEPDGCMIARWEPLEAAAR